MSSSGKTPDYNERALQLREKELEIRERELAVRELELRANRGTGRELILSPAGTTEERNAARERHDELDLVPRASLSTLLLKILKNGCYASSTIMLASTIGAIFTAQPSAALIALGFTLVVALTFMGVIFHLALWNEGGDV